MRPAGRGRFVTLEGGDGVGKSTQVRLLAERLRGQGVAALATREPGGSELAEAIRPILLSGLAADLGALAEALLFSVARIDHLQKAVRPALAAGTWVVCDRFIDSTTAYQGVIGGVDLGFLADLQRRAVADVRPDLTVVIDLPAEVALARAAGRRPTGGPADRFERETLGFHRRLREAFRAIASAEPERCVVVDGDASPAAVADAIWSVVRTRAASEGWDRLSPP